MATQTNTITISLKAGADLSAKQYLFVEISAAQTVNACDGTTNLALGVLQNDPTAAGQPAIVAIVGTTKVVAGAAITAGARVSPMASGKAQTTASTQFPRGIALDTATADGDVIEIALISLTVMA